MTKYLLGIEIIGSQLKIATVRRDKQFKLIRFDKLQVPLGDASAEFIKDWVIKNFKQGDEIKASVSVSESSLFLEKVKVPAKVSDNLDEAIYWELSNILPFSVSEAIYDWKLSSEQDGSYVYVVTAKSEFIDNWVSLFESAGIKIKLIEPSSVSFSRLAKIDFSKRTLSLMVEENATDLVIMENKIPIFSTSINISIARAEDDRRKLSKNVVDEIAEEAKKIVHYWEEKEEKKIEQATITGYIANKYFGLASAINKFLEVPVVIAKAKVVQNFNRTGFIENNIEQNMVAIGSALGLTDEKLVLLNLLSYEGKKSLMKERKELKRLSNISLFLKTNLAVIGIFLIGFLTLLLLKKMYVNKMKVLEDEITTHPGQQFVQQTVNDNKMLSVINNFFNSYENKTEKLNLITSLTPAGIAFTSIDYKNTKDQIWTISGNGSRDQIIAFYKKLLAESNAKSVTMPYSNLNKAEDNDFEILITW